MYEGRRHRELIARHDLNAGVVNERGFRQQKSKRLQCCIARLPVLRHRQNA